MRDWLKRLQIKGFVAGVLVTVMLSGTLLVSANTGGVMREVFYGVSIVINGNQWNPPADMTPFIADGRTFLPVRGIAQALDVPVEWDGATRTVFIGTIPHGRPFFTTVPFFERSSSSITVETVNMQGEAHANSLRATNSVANTTTLWTRHSLNAQYNTLTGTVGRIDGFGSRDSTVVFIGDGVTLGSVIVTNDSTPTDISIDVRGVLILEIQMQVNGWGGSQRVALVNAMIQ